MKLLVFISCLLLVFKAQAEELKIEPVYSVETTQRQFPEPPKTVTNTYLGVRALYGVPLLSAELEVAQSFRSESFPTEDQKIDYTTQRAMLGARSYPITSKMLGVFFRAGARAKKEKRDITENGESYTKESAVQYDPYAGTGLTIVLGKLFSLNAGATLVYNKEADSSQQYDALYSLSFTIKAGSK